MNNNDKKLAIQISKKIIAEVEKEMKNHIGNAKSGKIVKMGADGTPTSYID